MFKENKIENSVGFLYKFCVIFGVAIANEQKPNLFFKIQIYV